VIPGIELELATEQRVWAAFDKWASHFKCDLAAGGVTWLVRRLRSSSGSPRGPSGARP